MTQLDDERDRTTDVGRDQLGPSRRAPHASGALPEPTVVRGTVSAFLAGFVGVDPPVAFECWDGSRLGPADADATIVIRSREAFRRIVTAPGELGFARAWVSGDVDVQGDLYAALALRHTVRARLSPSQMRTALKLVGPMVLRPLRPPPEEARLRGRRHGRARDAAAINHHYDVSNAFYRIVLGPSLTYSCAVWQDATTLEQAQYAKHELISRKLDLGPGDRLLDVGCGWGSMLLHAAKNHGVRGVGVTVSVRQAELARTRVADAGLSDRIAIRLQDYRDIDDGPYDAISSIGMFEHVGAARLGEYFAGIHRLLRPGGRFLNHGISRPPGQKARFSRRSFIDRYVFPDGELHELGLVVSAIQEAGFEARHIESLREHYALTLRAWVANLERHWDFAVAEAGEPRARIWRLYMAACALGFEDGGVQVHQVLGVRNTTAGASGMPKRPSWDGTPLVGADGADQAS
jgi:cyclopropane-fatty-acyl-phospholipid synthase